MIIQLEVFPYKVVHFITLLLEFIYHLTVTHLVAFKIWLFRNPKRPCKKVIHENRKKNKIDYLTISKIQLVVYWNSHRNEVEVTIIFADIHVA